jgi:hypothetical protein
LIDGSSKLGLGSRRRLLQKLSLEALVSRFSANLVSGLRIAALLAVASAGSLGCGGGPTAGAPGTGSGQGAGTSGVAASAGGSGGSTGGAGAAAGTNAPVAGGTGGNSGGGPGTDAGTGTDDAAGDGTTDDAAGVGTPGDATGDGTADDAAGVGSAGSVVWLIDNLQSIGGHPTTVSGAPQVIDTPAGKAVQFNGTDGALFVEYHPLAGLAQFTVEVIFRPDPGGAPEQRFFHMQANGSENRVLFETRLPGNGQWFLDTYVMSNAGGAPLFAQNFPHPIGPWYHAALIIDGAQMRHYVNGVQELAVGLKFQPQLPGRTAFGVRLTKAYWYKGAIRLARFTPRVLSPAEFLKAN